MQGIIENLLLMMTIHINFRMAVTANYSLMIIMGLTKLISFLFYFLDTHLDFSFTSFGGTHVTDEFRHNVKASIV